VRKRARKIADQIITDSFPLLRGKKIFYVVLYLRYYAFSVWIPPFLRVIALSTRTKKFDDYLLTGILAHELCHQERYISMGIVKYFRFVISYSSSKKLQKEEERATGNLTIEKGYSRQLYELTLRSYSDKKHKGIRDNYLTPEEIRVKAMECGNWLPMK
jgi:hypothetical protein